MNVTRCVAWLRSYWGSMPSLGVPLSAHRPCQKEARSAGSTASSNVGVSGVAAHRVLLSGIAIEVTLKRRSAKVYGSLPLLHLVDRTRLHSGYEKFAMKNLWSCGTVSLSLIIRLNLMRMLA